MGAPDDPGTARARKLAAKRANERIRLLAGFLNALAIAVAGAGFIITAVSHPDRIAAVSFVWCLVGVALRPFAQAALSFRRSED